MEGNRLYYDNLTVVKPSSKLTKEHRAFIAEFLKNNQDKKPVNVDQSDADTPTPNHENLRIGEWE